MSTSRKRNGTKLLRIRMMTSIVALLVIASVSILMISSSDAPPAPVPAMIEYSSHVPIFINGDAQFNNTGFPNNGVVSGNGTASNPYVIEGWNISATSVNGISIQNTSMHFIVRDCFVHDGGWSHHGIFLYNSFNGVLTDNNCSNNTHGIRLFSSDDNIISNNTCSDNEYGTYLINSWRNAIRNNTCSSNSVSAIFLTSMSDWNTLSGNNCSSNDMTGIYLFTQTDHNIIDNNNCSNNQVGITLDLSCDENTLTNNTISSNGYLGMDILSCSNNILAWNKIHYNFGFGIFSNPGNFGNVIWNNSFIGNNGSGSMYEIDHIQNYDACSGNYWNSSSGYGNYWGDLTSPDAIPPYGIVDWSYNLTGPGGAKDYYPLTTVAPPIPEFSEMIIPIVGLMMIALIAGRTRKKP